MTLLLNPTTQEVTRKGSVSYVDGLPVPGLDTTFEIIASIQPMGQDELKREAEGLRATHGIRIYTSPTPALRTATDAGVGTSGELPDILTFDGIEYQVHKRVPYPPGAPVPHAKYVALAGGTGRGVAP